MRTASIILVAGLAGAASADITTFTDQGDFISSAGGLIAEDFEDAALIGTPEGGGQSFLDFDGFGVTSDIPALKVFNTTLFGNSNTTPGGSQYLAADTDVGFVGALVTFTFDVPVTEFGAFFIDIESTAVLSVAGEDFNLPVGGNGSAQFFGVISDDSFTTVSIDFGTDSFNSFDDLSFSIPAPGSVALLTGAGLLFVRRRR